MTEILKPLLARILFSSLIVVLSSISLSAQSYNTSSSKAIKYFEKARQEFLNKNYDKALSNVNKSLQKDDRFTDAYLLKAEIGLEMSDDIMALKSYGRILEIDSMAFPKCAISLAKLYEGCFLYDESESLLSWFLSLPNQKESVRKIAERELSLVKVRRELYENPVEYNPENIGSNVNTHEDEYVNQYYVNEDKIIFTRHYKTENEYYFEDNVFVATKYDSLWSIPQVLFDNIGAANVSADGNEIYFSGCGWNNGFGSCDIYYVKFDNGKWSTPINIKSINTSGWESQPCISYDGKELYFVRGNKSLGNSDLFVSYRDDNGNWTKGERLNNSINTDGNEMAPFIHYDGRTLYFSSDTHLGMGGYDLFVSRRDGNNEWTQPINLGYPLNSSGDEINLVVSNDAIKAFISSVRDEGYGGYDIYEFDLDEKFRPEIIEIEKPSVEEYYAEALEKQRSVVLKNIYFDFDSHELRPDSEDGINAVYNFLILNPDKNILLEGHTDNVGKEEYNLRLSEKRAESVKNALINKGISSERIKTKGCGSSQPLSTNNFDDELKTLNRRVSMALVD